MKYEIPKTTFMGKPIEGAMKRVLEGNPIPPNNPQPDTNLSLMDLKNPEDYILLSGRSHGTNSYPDLFVSMYRLGMSPEVETASRNLGYSVANIARELNGKDYIGNINWKQALSLNLSLGGRTLNPRQFADFLLLLKSGNAVDGTGRKIPDSRLTEILNEITEVRNPYRAEWLDADFKYLGQNNSPVESNHPDGKLWIFSDHIFSSAKDLSANYKRKLESCLMTKGSRINLGTINSQGMPTEEGNDFQYWCTNKDNNSVAGFGAVSGGADLFCDGDPTDTDFSLGVRLCFPAKQVQKNI